MHDRPIHEAQAIGGVGTHLYQPRYLHCSSSSSFPWTGKGRGGQRGRGDVEEGGLGRNIGEWEEQRGWHISGQGGAVFGKHTPASGVLGQPCKGVILKQLHSVCV